jgi:FlaA1/EpsC-like NDP-sugar epimerase
LQHSVEFVGMALPITLVANHVFGLYGRMRRRHGGAEEARHLALSAAIVVVVLVAIYPFGRRPGAEFPPSVFLVGCMVATLGMGVLRINSRLFAWLRNERRDRAASLATRH